MLKIDLHVHSVESDGMFTIQEIMTIAAKNGVEILALTDHESTQGVASAQRLGSEMGIKIIPGVEFLTYFEDSEIHLLGYFPSVENKILQDRLRELRHERSLLAEEMIKILQDHGYSLQWLDVKQLAGTEAAVSRGHIIRALYHGNSFHRNMPLKKLSELFMPGGEAFIPFRKHPYFEAVDLIYLAGGIPVLAHPGLIRNQEFVPKLLDYKSIGVEVYYAYWNDQDEFIRRYYHTAQSSGRLMTGGTDFHGTFSKFDIGQIDVPEECAQILIRLLNDSTDIDRHNRHSR